MRNIYTQKRNSKALRMSELVRSANESISQHGDCQTVKAEIPQYRDYQAVNSDITYMSLIKSDLEVQIGLCASILVVIGIIYLFTL